MKRDATEIWYHKALFRKMPVTTNTPVTAFNNNSVVENYKMKIKILKLLLLLANLFKIEERKNDWHPGVLVFI